MGAEHDKIAEELALTVGPTPYLGVPLGSCWLAKYNPETRKCDGPARADVVTIKPSYTRFNLSIYEVKVSRADFLSDIRSEKWRSYLPHCHQFYFATVGDIVDKSDIPAEAGWVDKGKNGWSFRKHIKSRDVDIPVQTLQSLLFMRQRKSVRDRQVTMAEDAYSSAKQKFVRDSSKLSKLIGQEIAEAFARRTEIDDIRDQAKMTLNNLEYDVQQFEELMKSIPGCEETGKYFSMWRILEKAKVILEKARQEKS